MPCIQDILANKGSQIHTVPPNATVLEATQLMNDRRIGALVVMDGARVAGIFTERDVLRRVVARECPPAATLVRDAMTCEVVCATPDMDLDEASTIMRDRRIRHLPVCDPHGSLLGLISIGDLNAIHATTQEAQITFLNDYVFGRA
jgi:CBS domain-containing protein